MAVELKEHDMRKIPYPYETNSIDHVLCGGVMHILTDIAPVFEEVSRILRKGGLFIFSCMDHESSCHGKIPVKSEHRTTDAYNHSEFFVEKLSKASGFEMLHVLEFFVFMQGDKAQKRFFKTHAVRNLKIQ